MDAILVFNAGSTTLKFSLFDLPLTEIPQVKGLIESKDKKFQLTINGEKHVLKASNLREACSHVTEYLDFHNVQAVGHRVVHGGDAFTSPLVLNASEIKKIDKLSSLAPLHNPMNVEGIKIAKTLFPKVPQVAVFDTAFHSHMPVTNRTYAIPYKWYKAGIKRYGFHGINHQYCMERVATLLNQDIRNKKLITCHLGGGCSLAAITQGISIDTTMGFTPLEGLMMATRSGSIDPGILLHFLDKGISGEELRTMLNDESGLKGICRTSDMREILKRQSQPTVALGLDLFVHKLVQGIAAMAASLNGVDLLAFSGGIGENSSEIRERACKALSFFNVVLDPKKNKACKEDGDLSHSSSKVKVFRIQANEEWQIAKETLKLIDS